ncbi:hypothetical protein FJT64_007244 [Amphibalanus amphitrite]|uniref:Uncharacterized protein n=1 Tax=Amphibalanus amphitrite TaxID=1232801 RepID=A0A6A4VWA5_AMPAM|nr:hypothetical protein FJT64_007244 [Amphibalanus amphitrite]
MASSGRSTPNDAGEPYYEAPNRQQRKRDDYRSKKNDVTTTQRSSKPSQDFPKREHRRDRGSFKEKLSASKSKQAATAASGEKLAKLTEIMKSSTFWDSITGAASVTHELSATYGLDTFSLHKQGERVASRDEETGPVRLVDMGIYNTRREQQQRYWINRRNIPQQDMGAYNTTLPMSLTARHKLLGAAGTLTTDTTKVVEVQADLTTQEVRNTIFYRHNKAMHAHLGAYLTLVPDTILLGYILKNWTQCTAGEADVVRAIINRMKTITGETRQVAHLDWQRTLTYFTGMAPSFRTKAVYAELDMLARPGGVWPDQLSPSIATLTDMADATARSRVALKSYTYSQLFVDGPMRELYSFVRETDLTKETRWDHTEDSPLIRQARFEEVDIAGRAGPDKGKAEAYMCENVISSMKYAASYTESDEVAWQELWLPTSRGGVPVRVTRSLCLSDIKTQLSQREDAE